MRVLFFFFFFVRYNLKEHFNVIEVAASRGSFGALICPPLSVSIRDKLERCTLESESQKSTTHEGKRLGFKSMSKFSILEMNDEEQGVK